MTLSTYSELLETIEHWLERDDLTTEPADFVKLAEATLNKVVRNTRMIDTEVLTVPAATSRIAYPLDMLEPVYVQIDGDDAYPLEQVSVEQLTALRRFRTRTQAPPRFYAVVGRNLELAPTPAEETDLSLAYYQALPALTDQHSGGESNWLLAYHPDLYLYASLMHAQPFLRADERQQVMGNVLVQSLNALLAENRTATFDPTPAAPAGAAA